MNIDLLEKNSKIFTDGEWWVDEWGKDEKYYEGNRFLKAQVDLAFDELKKIFTSKWLLKQRDIVITDCKQKVRNIPQDNPCYNIAQEFLNSPESAKAYYDSLFLCDSLYLCCVAPHPLLYNFSDRGHSSFSVLVNLGLGLMKIREKNHLVGDIPKRLKNTKQYLGALFEMKILSFLITQGYSIKRNYPSGIGNKNCDFKISKKPEKLCIEVKQLGLSSFNIRRNELSNILMNRIVTDREIYSHTIINCVELSEDIQKQALTKSGLDRIEFSLPKMIEQIKTHIKDNIKNEKYGDHLIHGLVKYKLTHKKTNNDSNVGSFSGLSISFYDEYEKIRVNAIEESLDQLPKEIAGVIVVKIPLSIDMNDFKKYFNELVDKNTQKYSHISGIIILNASWAGGSIENQIQGIIFNKNSRYNITDYQFIKEVVKW